MGKRLVAVCTVLLVLCCGLLLVLRLCMLWSGPSRQQIVGRYKLEGWTPGHGTLLLRSNGTFEQKYKVGNGLPVRMAGEWSIQSRGEGKAYVRFTTFILPDQEHPSILHRQSNVSGMDFGWFLGSLCVGLNPDGEAKYVKER